MLNDCMDSRYHQTQEASREGRCGVPLCHQTAIWRWRFEQQVRLHWFLACCVVSCDLFHANVMRSLYFCRFIEHGEYKENQYGTSIEAIRSVQAKNKMCVVDVQPEVGAVAS